MHEKIENLSCIETFLRIDNEERLFCLTGPRSLGIDILCRLFKASFSVESKMLLLSKYYFYQKATQLGYVIKKTIISMNFKINYFNSTSSSDGLKQFWYHCKLCSSDKHALGDSKLMLVGKGKHKHNCWCI